MKSVLIPAVLATALLVAACKPGANAPASGAASAEAKPVATVNGKAISRNLFETYAKGVSGKEPADLTEEQRGQILDNLVRAELIAAQAEKDGLAAKPETAAMLELSRLNLLQQEMMQKVLADKTPTEQELRAEYEAQIGALLAQRTTEAGIAPDYTGLLDKLPAQLAGQINPAQLQDDKQIRRIEGIINSMTREERSKPELIKASRKRRIATGAGVPVQEVNRLIKQFLQARKIAKVMSAGAGGRRQLAQMLRGM